LSEIYSVSYTVAIDKRCAEDRNSTELIKLKNSYILTPFVTLR